MRLSKKHKIYCGLGMIAIGLLICTYVYHINVGGISIYIKNESNATLHDIRLIYTGGSIYIKNMSSDETYKTFINPESESHLELAWKDASGKEHFGQIDIYIEPDYTGEIRIQIDPKHAISWTDSIKIPTVF